MIKQKAYINGNFISTSKSIKINSPIDLKVMGTIPSIGTDQVDKAYEAAHYAQRGWKNLTRDQRIKYIETFLVFFEASKENITSILMRETGKTKKMAKHEIERTLRYIEDTIHAYYNIYYQNVDLMDMRENKKTASIVLEPIGTILTMSPFNYPIFLSLSKIIPALIAGNTVVHFPSRQGSITSCELSKLFFSARFPKGVFNLVTGKESIIGNYLTSHKLVDTILFSGNSKLGKKVFKNFSMHKNIQMELEGNSAAIVLSNVNIQSVVEQIIEGAFSYSGQRFSAIKRVLVDKKINEEFLGELKRQLTTKKMGSPLEEDAFIVPVINVESASKLQKLIEDSLHNGAEILTGGIIEQNCVQATTLINCTPRMKIVRDPQMGPVLPVLQFSSKEEAIKMTNSTEFGLQVSIFSNNINEATELGSYIQVGSVNINGIPTREPDVLPYLGIKESGFGIQGINYVLKSVTRPKPFIINKIKK